MRDEFANYCAKLLRALPCREGICGNGTRWSRPDAPLAHAVRTLCWKSERRSRAPSRTNGRAPSTAVRYVERLDHAEQVYVCYLCGEGEGYKASPVRLRQTTCMAELFANL